MDTVEKALKLKGRGCVSPLVAGAPGSGPSLQNILPPIPCPLNQRPVSRSAPAVLALVATCRGRAFSKEHSPTTRDFREPQGTIRVTIGSRFRSYRTSRVDFLKYPFM